MGEGTEGGVILLFQPLKENAVFLKGVEGIENIGGGVHKSIDSVRVLRLDGVIAGVVHGETINLLFYNKIKNSLNNSVLDPAALKNPCHTVKGAGLGYGWHQIFE